MLEKKNRMNLLYDFYYKLLTDKQKHYMELYHQEDLSLGEIAEQTKVSRQAIFEHLKRAERLLEEYEAQLSMLAKFEQHQDLLQQLTDLLADDDAFSKTKAQSLVEQLKNVD